MVPQVLQRESELNTRCSMPSDFPGNISFTVSGIDNDMDSSILDNIGSQSLDIAGGLYEGMDTMSSSMSSWYLYDSANSKRFLQAYYLHFHAAHPVLLPFRHETKQLIRNYPPYLLTVVQCVRSQYEHSSLSETYIDTIGDILAIQTKRDGYLVQAMLISSVVLHAQNRQQQARQLLNDAIEIALNLGMNRRQFAADNSMGSQWLEESWRRTWWELYVLDGMLAALHQQGSFRLHGMGEDVQLPCEESDYSNGEVSDNELTFAVSEDV